MDNQSITRIEWAQMIGKRPPKAGCNSQKGVHEVKVTPGIARVKLDNGASAFGWSRITKE